MWAQERKKQKWPGGVRSYCTIRYYYIVKMPSTAYGWEHQIVAAQRNQIPMSAVVAAGGAAMGDPRAADAPDSASEASSNDLGFVASSSSSSQDDDSDGVSASCEGDDEEHSSSLESGAA